MAEKKFLYNRNDVAYCTSIGKNFEPNMDGVMVECPSMPSFAVTIATKDLKPKYPNINIIRALSFNEVKEAFIEKNFNVLCPVNSKTADLDAFLERAHIFTREFREQTEKSIKSIHKMNKGDKIKFKTPFGSFILIYGESLGPTEFVRSNEKSNVENVIMPCRLDVESPKREIFHRKKQTGIRDSAGNDLDLFESPEDDVISYMSEFVGTEVHTIARGVQFKIVIHSIKDVRCLDKERGNYGGTMVCKFLQRE